MISFSIALHKDRPNAKFGTKKEKLCRGHFLQLLVLILKHVFVPESA
jgi:hypothetical protein